MKTLTPVVLAAAAALLLHLSGPNEPEWLGAAVFALLICTICYIGVILEDVTSIENDPVRPEYDEHRDNSI